MNNGSRIIRPGIVHPESRSNRRLSLIEANKRLMDLNTRQAATIKAMNQVFTDIVITLGISVPQNQQEGVEALAKIMARIEELVHMKETEGSAK